MPDHDGERGANLVEYVMLLTLIALAVVTAIVFVGDRVSDKFGDAGTQLSNNGIETVVCGIWVERDLVDPSRIHGNVVAGLNPCAPAPTSPPTAPPTSPPVVTAPPPTNPPPTAPPPTTRPREDDDD